MKEIEKLQWTTKQQTYRELRNGIGAELESGSEHIQEETAKAGIVCRVQRNVSNCPRPLNIWKGSSLVREMEVQKQWGRPINNTCLGLGLGSKRWNVLGNWNPDSCNLWCRIWSRVAFWLSTIIHTFGIINVPPNATLPVMCVVQIKSNSLLQVVCEVGYKRPSYSTITKIIFGCLWSFRDVHFGCETFKNMTCLLNNDANSISYKEIVSVSFHWIERWENQ